MPKTPKPSVNPAAEKQARKEAKRQRKEERIRQASAVAPPSRNEPESDHESGSRSDTPPLTQAPRHLDEEEHKEASKPAETEEQKAARRERARKYAEERNRIHHVIVEARLNYGITAGVRANHTLSNWTIVKFWPSLQDVHADRRDHIKKHALNKPHITAYGSYWFEIREWVEHFMAPPAELKSDDDDMEED